MLLNDVSVYVINNKLHVGVDPLYLLLKAYGNDGPRLYPPEISASVSKSVSFSSHHCRLIIVMYRMRNIAISVTVMSVGGGLPAFWSVAFASASGVDGPRD